MFNDTSGHGTCTNYVPLKCQKCMWEGSLIQTFRAALCLEWSSAASSTQKTSDGHPGIQLILSFAQAWPVPVSFSSESALTYSYHITSACPQVSPLSPHRICGQVIKAQLHLLSGVFEHLAVSSAGKWALGCVIVFSK